MTYTIHNLASGRTFTAALGESVLDAGLRQGVALPYGCRNGACGSCKGRLVEGAVAYPGGRPRALSAEEASRGYAIFCQGRAASDLVIRVQEISTVGDIRVRMLPSRVVRREQLCHDVMALYLKLPDTERLQFLPGQYVDIVLKDGRRRAFSLANAPHDDEYLELHVRRYPGGEFSEYVFTAMKDKTLLRLRGPLGNFYLREDTDRPAILLAGGTGIAPIKSMVEAALEEGLSRELHIYWGVRSRRDLYLDDMARGWTQAQEGIRYVPVLSDPLPDDGWRSRTGLVHDAVLDDFDDLSGYEVYSSGPPVMVHAARDSFDARGLDPDRHYSDAFEFAYETGHNEQ